jgi:hypothetical protein
MALFEPIFDALNRRGVRYVIVGGVAVVLHGHARLTADLDIAVDLGPQAAREAVAALADVGLRPGLPVDANDFGDPAARERWQREKGMTLFSMWDPADPLRSVDLFVENPIDFEKLWSGAEAIDLDGTPTRIASIRDLIRLKRIAVARRISPTSKPSRGSSGDASRPTSLLHPAGGRRIDASSCRETCVPRRRSG